MAPKVSVIIPVYNTEKYLPKCLDSLLAQTLSDIEIICINDCSPDNSIKILHDYAKKDNRIKIIDLKENGGAGHARNVGIDTATGEYIGFVDSDDFVDPDFYEKLYTKATETSAEIVKGNLKEIKNNIKNDDFVYQNIEIIKKNKFLFTHVPTAIFRRTFLLQHNILYPINISCLEDTVFEAKASCWTNKIETCEDTTYYYVFNDDSLNNSSIFSNEKITDMLKALEQIVDFYNSVNLPEKIYIECLNFRYKALYEMAVSKMHDNITQLELFEKLSLQLEQKFKYQINTSFKNIDLFKFITTKRLIPKTPHQKITKRIFYVWFGNKKPISVEICLDNWREHLPDYEIIEINENSKYFDFDYEYNNCRWFKEVYDRKMWAFVSDYIRCKVLYDHGGIYLDTDITIKKDIKPLLNCDCFLGEEKYGVVASGVLGSIKGHPFYADMLDFYNKEIYHSPLYTIPSIMTEMINRHHYENITIFPPQCFYPFYYTETYTPKCVKENTYTIHWWNMSWCNSQNLYFLRYKHIRSQLKGVKCQKFQ